MSPKTKKHSRQQKRREQKLLHQRIHQTRLLHRMYDSEVNRRKHALRARPKSAKLPLILKTTKRRLLHAVGIYKTPSEKKAELTKHRKELYAKSNKLADERMEKIDDELEQIKSYKQQHAPTRFFLTSAQKQPRYLIKMIEDIRIANNMIYDGNLAKAQRLYNSILADYKKLEPDERKDIKPLVHGLYRYLKISVK